MEVVLGVATVVAVMIFGFGYGLIANSKFFPIVFSLWIFFILALIGTLILYILEVVHELIFPQLWLGFLFLAIVWLIFANFGEWVIRRLNKDAKTQQGNNKISKKSHHKEEEE